MYRQPRSYSPTRSPPESPHSELHGFGRTRGISARPFECARLFRHRKFLHATPRYRPVFLAAAFALLIVLQLRAQSIVGAWTYSDTVSPTSAGTAVFVFLANGVYFHAESDNTADALNGSNGMERGTFLWNPTSGAFSATTAVNTNDGWGFSNDVPTTISISGSTMDIEGTTLTQVSAVPEPSTYAALAGVAALGLVIWRRRHTHTAG